MNLSKIAVRRPVTTAMVVLIVIAFGILSITNLKMDMMPNMNIPVAIVSTTYTGTGPAEMETLVTEPLEGVLGTVPGIKNISSISSYGSSVVILEFEDNTDIDLAAIDMRERVDLIKGYLPDGSDEPMVMKIDMNAMTSLSLSIASEKYDLVELTKLVDDKITDRIKRQPGVAQVNVSGGVSKEISVVLKEEKLRLLGISEQQIAQLLMIENRNTPTGTIKQGDKNLQLRVSGEFQTIDDLKNTIVTAPTGTNFFLSDLADITEVFKDAKTLSYLNGKPCVNISIQKQSTANTVNVSDNVLKEIEKIKAEMPEVQVNVIIDPADFIRMTLKSVMEAAYLGAFLSIVILYTFLRNWRSTFIVATAMPISIFATFVLMYYSNITLNMMSLGGLALGIGMLVDNSIVVLESIYRKFEEGCDSITASLEGAREVAAPVTAATLTHVAVFLPITFAGGIIGQVFNELAMTVAFSLISSLFVSLTVVPMGTALIIRPHHAKMEPGKGIISAPFNFLGFLIKKLESGYKKTLLAALKHKFVTLAITIALTGLTWYSMRYVPQEFMPPTDESAVTISVSLPKGSLLEETNKIVDEVVKRVGVVPEVTTITANLGGSGDMLSSGTSDSASINITLLPKQERTKSSDDIAREMSKMVQDIPGAEIAVNAAGFAMGGGSFSESGVSIDIKGPELGTLTELANDMKTKMATIPGTRDADTSISDTSPQATIKVDRMKASTYGISAATVSSIVNTAISGTVATTYKMDGDELDIRLRQDKNKLDYIMDLQNILIPAPSGINVPLYEIAEIKLENLPVSINRNNQTRYVSVSVKLDGRAAGDVQKDIEAMFANYPMPSNYTWELSQSSSQMNEAFGSLGLALLMSLLLVYMIMAAQFESLIYPFIIMFAVPISLTGGLAGLFITGGTLSITSYLGLIMAIGIVLNNGIVLIDYANLLRRERDKTPFEAISIAGPVRLRPIVMSTLTTTLGLLPLMISNGEGSEMMAGLATVVIFGLILSTFVTLLFVPVVYMAFNNLKSRLSKKTA